MRWSALGKLAAWVSIASGQWFAASCSCRPATGGGQVFDPCGIRRLNGDPSTPWHQRTSATIALKHTQLSRSVRRHVVVGARERARAKPHGAKLGVLELNLDEHVVFGIATEFGD